MHSHAGSDCRCHRISYALLKLFAGIVFLSLVFAAARAQDAAQGDDTAAPARAAGRVVRLSDVEGDVQVTASGGAPGVAVANMPLAEGYVVQTGADGKAEVQFEDGSLARIVPASQLTLTTLQGSAVGNLTTALALESGTGYLELNPAGDSSYTVAAGMTLKVPNHASFRVDLSNGPAQVGVADGSVELAGYDRSMPVYAGQTVAMNDDGPVIRPGTTALPYDQWNEDRDSLTTQEQANTTDTQQGSDSSGWSDLDYYGNWYSVPGVGQVWQPFGYGGGFDPYDSGYWADYPWGYTWISAYPWGWAPFHCGYWNYWDSFGWGWVGNDCGIGSWYTISPVYRGPANYRLPRRPHFPPARPGQGPRRHGIPLQPVGRAAEAPYRPAMAHPAPHNNLAQPVMIGGHPAQLIPAAPRNEQNAPGKDGLASGLGVHHGPERPRIAGSLWHGQAPASGRNAPARSSGPAPSHSAPPAASHSESSSSHDSSKK